ncbi:hypothetical protein EV651_108193 [Kribbella sp. VKM Ac-2571]|uniref:hypothetical protein n=1 Tax=Kribbella sp. VKM Ac-2571 TaxID=2512222 RepID=UPI0010610BE2|nr:hypothetical protein [Kribbella sp. VKM Ac-2571]TDO59847.1 hypothetical protein EV651_108193 [Kribbella sp. VKM Ac-2571]
MRRDVARDGLLAAGKRRGGSAMPHGVAAWVGVTWAGVMRAWGGVGGVTWGRCDAGVWGGAGV